MAYEIQKVEILRDIELRTGIVRKRHPELESLADERAYEGYLEVGTGPDEDGNYKGISHPPQAELERRLGDRWTEMGVGEIAIWGYLIRNPSKWCVDGWMASSAHRNVLIDARYKYLDIGIYTFMPPNAEEYERRWYWIGTVSINAPTESPKQTFTDVPPTHPHYGDIEWLAGTGITSGTGDGSTFSPNAAVTRAQMATFIRRLDNYHRSQLHK